MFWLTALSLFMALQSQAQGQTCGLSGTVDERAAHCNHSCTPDWSPEAQWRLVTRTQRGQEVWQHIRFGDIWSHISTFRGTVRDAESVCRRGSEDFMGRVNRMWRVPNPWDVRRVRDLGLMDCLPEIQREIWVDVGSSTDQSMIYDGFSQMFRSVPATDYHYFRCVSW